MTSFLNMANDGQPVNGKKFTGCFLVNKKSKKVKKCPFVTKIGVYDKRLEKVLDMNI